MCGYDMAKTIYPITCNCCYPAQILKNYDAKKYHLKRMRAATSAAESESDSNIASTPSVNIFVFFTINYYCNLILFFQVNSFIKEIEPDGRIYNLFKHYIDDRFSLKLLVNHELSEKSREVRLAIRTKDLTDIHRFRD